MKTWLSVCGVIAVAAPIALAAQGTAPQAGASGTPPISISTMNGTITQQYKSAKDTLTKMADAMPAESYGFQPTPEMRSYAASMAHIISGNIGQCGSLLGKKHALSGVDLSKTLTTKTDVVKAMADSLAFCDEYFNTIDDKSQIADTFTTMTGHRKDGTTVTFKISNGASLVHFLEHNNEMIGYMSVYLRLKGIVPPQSVPAGRGGNPGAAR